MSKQGRRSSAAHDAAALERASANGGDSANVPTHALALSNVPEVTFHGDTSAETRTWRRSERYYPASDMRYASMPAELLPPVLFEENADGTGEDQPRISITVEDVDAQAEKTISPVNVNDASTIIEASKLLGADGRAGENEQSTRAIGSQQSQEPASQDEALATLSRSSSMEPYEHYHFLRAMKETAARASSAKRASASSGLDKARTSRPTSAFKSSLQTPEAEMNFGRSKESCSSLPSLPRNSQDDLFKLLRFRRDIHGDRQLADPWGFEDAVFAHTDDGTDAARDEVQGDMLFWRNEDSMDPSDAEAVAALENNVLDLTILVDNTALNTFRQRIMRKEAAVKDATRKLTKSTEELRERFERAPSVKYEPKSLLSMLEEEESTLGEAVANKKNEIRFLRSDIQILRQDIDFYARHRENSDYVLQGLFLDVFRVIKRMFDGNREEEAKEALRKLAQVAECVMSLPPPRPVRGDSFTPSMYFLWARTRDECQMRKSNVRILLEKMVGQKKANTMLPLEAILATETASVPKRRGSRSSSIVSSHFMDQLLARRKSSFTGDVRRKSSNSAISGAMLTSRRGSSVGMSTGELNFGSRGEVAIGRRSSTSMGSNAELRRRRASVDNSGLNIEAHPGHLQTGRLSVYSNGSHRSSGTGSRADTTPSRPSVTVNEFSGFKESLAVNVRASRRRSIVAGIFHVGNANGDL